MGLANEGGDQSRGIKEVEGERTCSWRSGMKVRKDRLLMVDCMSKSSLAMSLWVSLHLIGFSRFEGRKLGQRFATERMFIIEIQKLVWL